MIEERWPEERGLADESDAYESREGVHRFESDQEHSPSHDMDSRRDSISLERRQREEY